MTGFFQNPLEGKGLGHVPSAFALDEEGDAQRFCSQLGISGFIPPVLSRS